MIFGNCFLEEFKEDLLKSRYSVNINNCTIRGEIVCALKVRFLKQKRTDQNLLKTHIENKVIGPISKSLKERLFDLDEQIRNNFIDITHERAVVLSGEGEGLIQRIAKLLNIQTEFFTSTSTSILGKNKMVKLWANDREINLDMGCFKVTYGEKKFKSQKEHDKCQEMYVPLSDDVFKLKTILLSDLLKKLNKTNETYQSQSLETQPLKVKC